MPVNRFLSVQKALSTLFQCRNSYLGEHLFESLLIFRTKLCNLGKLSAFATFCQSVFSRLHKSQLVSQNLDMSINQKRNSFLLILLMKLSKAKYGYKLYCTFKVFTEWNSRLTSSMIENFSTVCRCWNKNQRSFDLQKRLWFMLSDGSIIKSINKICK